MLCLGVFVMWLFPVKYSLFGGTAVAFLCCLILYLVAIETNEKRFLSQKNEDLQRNLEELLKKEESPEKKLISLCKERKISERDTKIAVMYFIENKKPKQIWLWLCENNENMEYDSVYKLLNRLIKRLK